LDGLIYRAQRTASGLVAADAGKGVISMSTTILFFMLALLAIISIPRVADRSHTGAHHTDLMAGEE
jgi:hypothetical protein